MLNPYVYLSLAIILNLIGNHLFKATAISLNEPSKLTVVISFFGFGSYFGSAILYIIALRKIPLSVAYPTIALTYPLTIVLAFFLFGEQITTVKILGALTILFGVYLINASW